MNQDILQKILDKVTLLGTELQSVRTEQQEMKADLNSVREEMNTFKKEQLSMRETMNTFKNEQLSMREAMNTFKKEQLSMREAMNTFKNEQLSMRAEMVTKEDLNQINKKLDNIRKQVARNSEEKVRLDNVITKIQEHDLDIKMLKKIVLN